ncbi:MAG: hypothetical protein KDC57_21485, partial [Saprospiraceae bacterium]|nr:hypothetical protein [Saprospiraceae bacterium]
LQGRIIDRCFENGLLVYPSVGGQEGKDENGLLIAPPYVTSSSESAQLLDIFGTSISQVAQSL